MTPATQRVERDRETLESQNRSLEALVQRNTALVPRLRELLTEAEAEHRVIENELAEVLGGRRSAGLDK